ncbi:right-handed parallel beta-helix repeat-containing protein [Pullulanibacillus camelliae]|nr:right-handed parallel beta-helix repeat-containing protein [Pullulanibacillus camelliae]
MSGSYLLELERWQVKNDGTDAENSTLGINRALNWAGKQGFTRFILPKGIYLIDETRPVEPQSYMALDLGGSTLRMRDNGLSSYAVVSFRRNQQFARLTNGRIEGDRFTHDYSSGGTHEFGVGVQLQYGGQQLSIDNLEIFNMTGDGLIAITSFGGIGGVGMPPLAGNLESGGINLIDGTLMNEADRIRTKVMLPIVDALKNSGFFGLYGDSYGGIGTEVTTDLYDVIFYKEDESLLTAKTDIHFFDEVPLPQDAAFAKVVLHQSIVPSASGCRLIVRTPQFPKHVSIEKCHIHDCRRLGITMAGAKYVSIRECDIHDISGTAPQGAIDIEDGYAINQYIYIDNNSIYANKNYNIIAVAGRHISVTNNRLQDGIFTINSGVNEAIVDNNYFNNTGPRLEGATLFSNNVLLNSRMRLLGAGNVLIDHCFFHNTPLNFNNTKAFVAQVAHCKFLFDDDFITATVNPGSPLIFSAEPQKLSDCQFEGGGTEAFTTVPVGAHDWLLNNVSFLHIRHMSNRITRLPAGTYNSCTFVDCGRLGEVANPTQTDYTFTGCHFEWGGYSLFYMGPQDKVSSFKVKGCQFQCDGTGQAFFLKGNWGRLEVTDNHFNYTTASNDTMIQLWSTLAADSVLLSRNTFIAVNSHPVVNAADSPSVPLIFEDNTLIHAEVKLNDLHEKRNNRFDGAYDPYNVLETEPSTGFFKVGQVIKNASPQPGEYFGWVCVTEGFATTISWQPLHQFVVNARVYANGNVYQCTKAGTTSSIAPSQKQGTVTDGTVTWEWLGAHAVFARFGSIEEK